MANEEKPYPLISAAITAGDLDEVQRLFARFPEAKGLKLPSFGTWLHYAAAHGTLPIVQFVLSLGFDVNSRDNREERSPLDYAAANAQQGIAAFLIENGATIDTSSSVRNPLFGAIIGRSKPIADRLIQTGMDTTVRYPFGGDVKVELDAVGFAMLRGEREIAKAIALKNAAGDQTQADAAMREGLRLAEAITEPSPEN